VWKLTPLDEIIKSGRLKFGEYIREAFDSKPMMVSFSLSTYREAIRDRKLLNEEN
jgi:hypothetical protein